MNVLHKKKNRNMSLHMSKSLHRSKASNDFAPHHADHSPRNETAYLIFSHSNPTLERGTDYSSLTSRVGIESWSAVNTLNRQSRNGSRGSNIRRVLHDSCWRLLLVGILFTTLTLAGCSTQPSAVSNSGSAKEDSNATTVGTAVAQQTKPATSSASTSEIDFDQAIKEVSFSLTADDNGPEGQNGIPDSVEMALIARVLNEKLSIDGGVDATKITAAWEQAHASASVDVAQHLEKWPHLATLVAGYALVGTQDSFDAINKLSTSFGSPLQGDYQLALQLGNVFGPEGDADGDGFTNRQEYSAFGGESRDAYLAAALTKETTPTTEQLSKVTEPKKTRYSVGIILYDGFEVLDTYGPVEMWGNVTEFDLYTVAEKKGPVRSAQGLATIATYDFEDAPRLDILLVPGGNGTIAQLRNEKMISFLKRRHVESTWTTSVCTGSALLAKAGILDGLRATSNKAFFSIAKNQSSNVQWVESARWVEDGKVFTSSGVSAGTDMSLALVGKIFGLEKARLLAKQLEYQWHEDKDKDPFAIQSK